MLTALADARTALRQPHDVTVWFDWQFWGLGVDSTFEALGVKIFMCGPLRVTLAERQP
jgi:hypothetical protein